MPLCGIFDRHARLGHAEGGQQVVLHSIFGGVHLEGRKQGSQRKPLALLDVEPEQVVIPVSMHAGEPCVPVVSVGQQVAAGQPVARGETTLIHASVSGQVTAVEPRPHPWGEPVLSVVICNDKKQTRWQGVPEKADYRQLSEQGILERIAQAGVVGMGGGGYPTAEKLLRARGRVDTLIINAAESEPYITADHRLLLEQGEGVLLGLQILMKAAGVRNGVVAVEGNKLNAVEVLERTAKRRELPCRVCTVPSRYPLGAEKQVVRAVTGREVPPGGTAVGVRCVVFNAATAFAVYQAVAEGRALTHRVVTVTGAAVVRPRNLWVPIGTPLRDLICAAGGLREEPDLVLVGGPMAGMAQTELSVPVTKLTNGVVCMLDWEHAGRKTERGCIRCGRCVSVCPMHLMPLLVDKELKLGADVRELARLNTGDCMSCGCCSYVCPANIPLVERMAQARQIVEQGGKGEEATL